MVNHGKVKHFISIEKKLFVDEAMIHIKNGNYNKAIYLYNKMQTLEMMVGDNVNIDQWKLKLN